MSGPGDILMQNVRDHSNFFSFLFFSFLCRLLTFRVPFQEACIIFSGNGQLVRIDRVDF